MGIGDERRHVKFVYETNSGAIKQIGCKQSYEIYVFPSNTPKNLRPLKAVLKGVPTEYTEEEILAALDQAGLKIDKVTTKSSCRSCAKGIYSKKVTQGVSFCQLVQGAPPTPSPVSATENQQNHPVTNNNNVNNCNSNDATKAIFVLNELVNIFNSMGGLENMYAALSSATNPLAKLASVLSVLKPIIT
ncbi:hypothetical protein CEXT_612611 [Caerostris extrusa]|uniref:Uncharacterized protein n=1 Tax=Caerostris extrusa TaxID=172846 RepID=A0AAV4SIM5_CAEEX|nr:hypothetical protein CEXT_612611 [Caerostris extrusa]